MTLRDDVLESTDIVDLVNKYVQLKKVGKNWVGLCPFHREKTPSFTVAEDKQIFKCFGCGQGGNAITFLMEIEKIDFRDTMKMLAHDAHIDISKYQKDPEQVAAKKESKEKFKLLNKRIQKIFQDAFTNSPAARYAKDQRKLSEATIATFCLGYAADSHYDTITHLQDKGFTNDDLIQAGLAKQSKNGDIYAFFRHRLTFPIHDHIGNIVGFGARALDADQNPKYLNTTETPLYDKSKILFGLHAARKHLRDRELLIVVEGYMDVIALHQYGLPIGIATCGTALTPQHTKLIKRHTENVLFAFDHDSAGFDAIIRGLKVAYQQDLFPKVLTFPTDYKDVDERLTATYSSTNHTLTKEETMQLATDGFRFVLDQLLQNYDLMNPVERKKVLRSCFDILQHIDDWTILSLYLDHMSTPFGTATDILLQQFKRHLKQKRTTNFSAQEEQTDKTELPTKYLLATLWYDTAILGDNYTLDPLQQRMKLIAGLSKHFPTSLIAQIENSTITSEDKQHLLEAQLRWEHQFGDLPADKQAHIIIQFLKQQLQQLQRMVLKSTTISDEEKQRIIQDLRNIKKA